MTTTFTVPLRLCNGRGKVACGKQATRVCVEGALQWFACDEPDHASGAVETMPIREWFERFVWGTKSRHEGV